MTILTVNGIAHLGLVSDDYETDLAMCESVLGGVVGKERRSAESEGQSALVDIGPIRIAVSAAPGGSAPQRGWSRLAWRVSPFGDVAKVLKDHGIGSEDEAAGRLVRIHRKDLHGLGLELIDSDLAVPDRGEAQPAVNPLGLTAKATIKVASARPAEAVEAVARLVGGVPYTHEHPQFNTIGHGIAFDDHALEFVGSRTHGSADLVGRFLAAHGAGILCLNLTVADLEQARRWLVAAATPFSQWGRSSLLLGRESTNRTLVELTADH